MSFVVDYFGFSFLFLNWWQRSFRLFCLSDLFLISWIIRASLLGSFHSRKIWSFCFSEALTVPISLRHQETRSAFARKTIKTKNISFSVKLIDEMRNNFENHLWTNSWELILTMTTSYKSRTPKASGTHNKLGDQKLQQRLESTKTGCWECRRQTLG